MCLRIDTRDTNILSGSGWENMGSTVEPHPSLRVGHTSQAQPSRLSTRWHPRERNTQAEGSRPPSDAPCSKTKDNQEKFTREAEARPYQGQGSIIWCHPFVRRRTQAKARKHTSMASNGSEGQPTSPIRPMTTLDETPPPTATNRSILGEGSSTTAAGNVSQPSFPQQGTTPVELLPSTQLQMPPFFAPPLQQARAIHLTTPPSSHIFNISPSFATPSPFQTTGGQSSATLLPPLAQTMMNHSPPFYQTAGTWTGPTIPANNSLQQLIMINPAASIHPFSTSYPLQLPFQPYNFMDQVRATLCHHRMDGLSRSVTSLFVKELLDYEIPNTAKLPTLKTYNGTTDPDSHIDTYEWTMTSLKLNKKFWCTYFPTTLDGNADTWFKTLQPDSISNFAQLKYLFLTNFMQLRKYKGDSHSIIGCKQREGETMREYFTRFTNATLDVPGHDKGLIAGAFTWGLLPGPLSQKLMGKKPLTRAELKERVERYLRQEEGKATKQAYLNAMATRHHHPSHTDFRGEQDTMARQEDHRCVFDHSLKMTDRVATQRCTWCLRNSSRPSRPRVEMEEKQLKGDLVEVARSLCAKFDAENAKGPPREGVQPKEIFMIRSKRSREEQRGEQATVKPSARALTFSVQDPRSDGWKGDNPLIIQASIRDVTIHRVYVDTGSSTDIIYEHCFRFLLDHWKDNLRTTIGRLVGFTGHSLWPLSTIHLPLTITSHDKQRKKTALAKPRYWPRRPKNCNVYTVMKPADITKGSKRPRGSPIKGKEVMNEGHPDQPISVGCDLPDYTIRVLVNLLKRYKHVFAWTPTDMVGVERKDGSWHMCIDFSDLNKACPKDCYPLLEIDQKVESLQGFKLRCFLDAYKGYHQILMSKEDEEKTAFYTDHNTFCYTKMPFGLKNAWATYQRLVYSIFAKQIGRNIEVYVDDMVIKSPNEEKMMQDIEETFQTLEAVKMKLNPAKCTFGVEEGQFLGYYVTRQGVQPSLTKVNEFIETPTPNSLRDAQGLNGKLTALSRFISKSADKGMPLFHTLKGCIEKSNFQWTNEAEKALRKIKEALHELPTLATPIPGETLQVYLSMSDEAISSVLVVEREGEQKLVYFVNRALQGPELNYPTLEKLVLALIYSTRRLRRYFQAHQIEVLTSYPIKQILLKPETSVRLAKWAIDLGEHDINYRPRTSIKGQALADFLLEIPDGGNPAKEKVWVVEEAPADHGSWTLYTDGASSREGSGAGLILTSREGEEVTYALRFDFHTSNNKAGYEALLAGLRLAKQMGAKAVTTLTDSRLAANQVNGSFEVRDQRMGKYVKMVKQLVGSFGRFTIKQIPRSENKRADALSQGGRDIAGDTLRTGGCTRGGESLDGQGVTNGDILANNTVGCDRSNQEIWGMSVLCPSPGEPPDPAKQHI
uniref:RNase H type-1 domain-containing protein n=1 Tax=Lactuca sativa TaxID=4236 RepID=A0A9R1W5E0_LACSA|nr:hypothetical protein LSAT_V11C300127070 [Lactuca sativa]